MAIFSLPAYAMANGFTNNTSIGLGAVKGAPAQIKSTSYDEDGNTVVVFEWTANDGVTKQETPVVILKGEKGERGTLEFDDNEFTSIEDMIANKDSIDKGRIALVTIDNIAYMFARIDGAHDPDHPELDGFRPLGSFNDYVWANEANEVEYKKNDVANVEEALDKLFSKVFYVSPAINTFVSTPTSGSREIGQKLDSIKFTWTTNKDVSMQTLTGCTITPKDRTVTYNTELKANKTFTLSIRDPEGGSATKSLSFSFLPKVYYGASALLDEYDSEFILGLDKSELKSSKSGIYTLNITTGKYGFIAMPVSFNFNGVPKIGGFDTELVDCGTISHTNASGYTQNYKLWRTGQPGLGSASMVVS